VFNRLAKSKTAAAPPRGKLRGKSKQNGAFFHQKSAGTSSSLLLASYICNSSEPLPE
jgi:hypothetical protein